MAERKFKVLTMGLIGTTPNGIVKDTFITDNMLYYPDFNQEVTNFGLATQLKIGVRSTSSISGGRYYWHGILEVQMPNKKDYIGLDELVKAELCFWVITTDFFGSVMPYPTQVTLAVTEISDNFDEGTGNNIDGRTTGYCNWLERIVSVPWDRGEGAVKSRSNIDESDKPILDAIRFDWGTSYGGTLQRFDISESIDFGDKKRFAIFVSSTDVRSSAGATDRMSLLFGSNQHGTNKPILRITYKDYAIEAFTDKDSALSIEPYESNREFPLLKWGGVKDGDFVDFKVYRDTVPITTIAGLSPNGVLLATIADPSDQEFVDETIALNGDDDGETFYYLVIAEDANNTLDDATKSTNVSFTKPDVSAFTFIPTGAQDVGTKIIATVGSGNKIKKVYMNWRDGSTPWYEFETVSTSKEVSHIYASYITSSSLITRVEDEKGFWSSIVPSSGLFQIDDIDPKAICIARPLELIAGEIVYMNASLSHPIANNRTITEYQYYDGQALTGWLPNQPFYSFPAPTNPTYPYTLSVYANVKAQGGLISTSNITDIKVISPDETKLEFSKDTVVTSRNEKRESNISTSMIQGGSGEIDVRGGLSNISITLNGISSRANLNDDLNLIRSAVANYTYVKVRARDEICGQNVVYYGRLISYTVDKTSTRHAMWNCEMRVIKRMEKEAW